jgi:hypothetical protein
MQNNKNFKLKRAVIIEVGQMNLKPRRSLRADNKIREGLLELSSPQLLVVAHYAEISDFRLLVERGNLGCLLVSAAA